MKDARLKELLLTAFAMCRCHSWLMKIGSEPARHICKRNPKNKFAKYREFTCSGNGWQVMAETILPKHGDIIKPHGRRRPAEWIVDFVANNVVIIEGSTQPIFPLANLRLVKPGVWELVDVKSTPAKKARR